MWDFLCGIFKIYGFGLIFLTQYKIYLDLMQEVIEN